MDADDVAAFAALGVAVDLPAAPARTAYEVWPENWDAVCAFLACETQWRVAVGQGPLIWLGLDYTAVDAVLRRQFPESPPAIFDAIRVMETAALNVFAEES